MDRRLFVALLASGLLGVGCKPSPQSIRLAMPDLKLRTAEFITEAAKDKLVPEAFEKKYNGRIIELTDGVFVYEPQRSGESIGAQISASADLLSYLYCYFPKDEAPSLANIKRSSSAHLKCRFGRLHMDGSQNNKPIPVLSDCVLLE